MVFDRLHWMGKRVVLTRSVGASYMLYSDNSFFLWVFGIVNLKCQWFEIKGWKSKCLKKKNMIQ